MFRSFKKVLERRLRDLEENSKSALTHETTIKDFVVGIFGFDALQFLKGVYQLPTGEVLVVTANKAFASELAIRKEVLIEYARDKGVAISSLRIQ